MEYPKTMWRSALFASFAIATLAVLPSALDAQAANELVTVSAHLKAVNTMTANFVQTDRAGKTLGGVLTIARPGRIRFQYEKGVPILLVSDGKALTFIDYSVKQVQRWPIGNSPLGVLLDANRDLSRFAKSVPAGNPRILIIEARDPKRPEFGLITLAFEKRDSAPGGLMLIGWVSLDSQNNRTSIRLSNQKFNVPVSGEAFKWSDPRPRIKGR
jgi:outer membrane lipoprotein-sorting protein